MKFTFLGTAAAEGFPAVFCNCKYCKEARAGHIKSLLPQDPTQRDMK